MSCRKWLLLTVSWVFIRDNFIAAEEKLLKWLFEILVEGDVDDGVDHGVRISEHVDPEFVSF